MNKIDAPRYLLESVLKHLCIIESRLPTEIKDSRSDLRLANTIRLLKKDIRNLSRILEKKK